MKTLIKILCLCSFSFIYPDNTNIEYKDTIIMIDGQIHVGKFIDYNEQWTYYNLNRQTNKKRKLKTSRVQSIQLHDGTYIYEYGKENKPNPCEDSLFIELKNKKLDDMSDREYKYFILKSEECSNYNNTLKLVETNKKTNKIIKETSNKYFIYTFIGLVIGVISIIIISSSSP